jgi:hypothetical protein
MSGLNIASIKNGEGARDLSAISKTNQMSTIRMYCDSHPFLNYFLGVGEAKLTDHYRRHRPLKARAPPKQKDRRIDRQSFR